ncbi:MAG: hypothetical protein M5U26_25635 [Planctomycetota bacterium]|nr:hypothetical protein [Planctomycetota bacterium]
MFRILALLVVLLLAGCGSSGTKKTAAGKPAAPKGPSSQAAFEKLHGLVTGEGFEIVMDHPGDYGSYLSGYKKTAAGSGAQFTIYHTGKLSEGAVQQVMADYRGADVPDGDQLKLAIEVVFQTCGYGAQDAAALAEELWKLDPSDVKGATATRELKRDGHYGYIIDARGEGTPLVKIVAMPRKVEAAKTGSAAP